MCNEGTRTSPAAHPVKRPVLRWVAREAPGREAGRAGGSPWPWVMPPGPCRPAVARTGPWRARGPARR